MRPHHSRETGEENERGHALTAQDNGPEMARLPPLFGRTGAKARLEVEAP